MTIVDDTTVEASSVPVPAVEASTTARTIQPDSNAAVEAARLVAELEDRRLLDGLEDRRFAGEAIKLARAGFARYDRKLHKLSHAGAVDRQPGEISYPEFFRRVALDAFAGTRNVRLAGLVLDRLIAEG